MRMSRRALSTASLLLAALTLLGIAALTCRAADDRARGRLPEAAAEAIRNAFPDAVIEDVEREREGGVMLYVVALTEEGEESEVEVTADGIICEIESVVNVADVPPAAAARIAKRTAGGKISSIERHERRGMIRAGKAFSLADPKVAYEVRFTLGRSKRRITVAGAQAAPGVVLPQAAREAVQAAFPGATLGKVEVEREFGLTLYEVVIQHNGRNLEVEVAADGTIAEVGGSASREDLPQAVADSIAEAAKGGKVVELDKVEARAVARLVELEEPLVTYEAEIARDGERLEVEVAADGTILHVERDDDDDDGDDDDD